MCLLLVCDVCYLGVGRMCCLGLFLWFGVVGFGMRVLFHN